jgi:hypothetical protein
MTKNLFPLRTIVAQLYIAYAVSIIFLPKIQFDQLQGIYFWEVICTPITLFLTFYSIKKIFFLSRFFFGYACLVVISFVFGILTVDTLNWVALFKFVKYFALVMICVVPFVIIRFRAKHIERILFSQIVFVLIFGSYVLYHTAFYPMTREFLMGSYFPEYRLIGLTGSSIDFSQPFGLPDFTSLHRFVSRLDFVEIGHTSVQMGAYLSILSVIYLAVFMEFGHKKHLIASAVMAIGTGLTYSRSGFLILPIAFLIITSRNIKHVVWLYLGIIFASIFLIIGLGELLADVGTLAKFSQIGFSDSHRIYYWSWALSLVVQQPWVAIMGVGLGNIQHGTLEGLFIDTFIESGIFSLFFLLLFFLALWRYSDTSRLKPSTQPDRFMMAVLNGIHASIPGIFVVCLVGGNPLFTDFIAPAFFLILGICLRRKQQLLISFRVSENRV